MNNSEMLESANMPDTTSSDSAYQQPERGHPDMDQRAASPTAAPQNVIACLKCGSANPHEHRFCRKCGSILWKKCPQCGSERPIDETFCAACGADIAAAERQLIDNGRKQLAEARQQIERLELNDALRTLNRLVRQKHPGLEEVREEAEQMIPRVTAETERYQELNAVHAGRAEILLKELRFSEVVSELCKIPAPLRDRQTCALLEKAHASLEEIETLKQHVWQPEGIAFDDRVAAIRRLMELMPHDSQVKDWARRIHDQVLRTAMERIKIHRYHETAELLCRIPAQLQSDRFRKLQRQAAELAYLESELQYAPTINSVSLEAARRLVKFDQQNQTAKKTLQRMTEQCRSDRRGAAAALEWTACPETTHVGLPVQVAPHPRRLKFATPEMEARYGQKPGQFLVACGLALQALDKAAINVNLMPSGKQGVLDRLRSGLRERPAKTGWGLDVSDTSLKAIQLRADDDDQVEVTRCVHIPHRIRLSHPDAQSTSKGIVLESLKTFVSEHELAAGDRVATQWPSIASLVRFLSLPQAEGKKWRDLVQREAQHQIPFPMAEVCSDTYTFPKPDENSTHKQVLLLAARLREVDERIALMQEVGIDVQIVQCDSLALHNYLHYELLTQDPNVNGIAALDVGSDATGIVLSFPNLVWFRAVRPADDDLITAIARRFKLTRDVAERVKRDPTKVKRMGDLHEQSCVIFSKLVDQWHSALGEWKKICPGKQIDQLLVTGGGGQTHGLLRFLRFGR